MRELDARIVARGLVGIEHKTFAVLELDRAFGERAQAKFWALKVDQDADRPAIAALDIANGLDQFAHLVVRGMAHIDAADVGAGLEQAADHRAVGRCGAKRCQNLDAAQTSHGLVPGAAAGGRPDAPGGVPPGGVGRPGDPPRAVAMPRTWRGAPGPTGPVLAG